jgi:uncharacterized glyoxalase superfamily protein PhnB
VLANRSIPPAVVIPELAYRDVGEAAAWLCAAFGFQARLRIANHRVQLMLGAGAIVVVEGQASDDAGRAPGPPTHGVMVRIENVDQHHARAVQHGALIMRPPTDYAYGERQYTALDPGGHVWTFSETIDDVDPAAWGGTLLGSSAAGA